MDLIEDAPDWRWRLARTELEVERDGLPFNPSSDVLIRSLKRFLRMWDDPDKRRAARRVMPEMAFLMDIRDTDGPGCLRHAVEAAAMANADPKFIRDNIHERLTDMISKAYEAIFFDVRPRLGSPFWVERHIFSKAYEGHRKMDDKLASDLVWKVVGYIGGPERLLKDCLRGHMYEGRDADWVIRHVLDQAGREALKYIHGCGKLPQELTVATTQRVVDKWADRFNRLEGSGEDSQGDIPDEFGISSKVRIVSSDEGSAEEELPGYISKYDDEEFAND